MYISPTLETAASIVFIVWLPVRLSSRMYKRPAREDNIITIRYKLPCTSVGTLALSEAQGNQRVRH